VTFLHGTQFNARSESVTEKPVFSRLLQRQRCVVLLDGFYEWKADAGGKKQPYYVSFGEGNVMRMAGLYDTWTGWHCACYAFYR
jgi:putative SOS response-associated peptidase YedK